MILGVLTEREADVIRFRFGIDILEEMTLEEVGALFDITPQRVYQIEKEALAKLRKSPQVKKLREYWED